MTPLQRGFDTQRGYYNAENDYYTHMEGDGYDWHVDDEPAFHQNGTFSDWLLRDAAVAFLRQRAAEAQRQPQAQHTQPWFLYLPMQAVHAPLQVPASYEKLYSHIKDEKKRTKAGMLTALDDALGAVLSVVNAPTALRNNTVTLFLCDNGAPDNYGGSNKPYRGWKHQLYEGGIRTPAIVHAANPVLLPPARRGTTHGGWFHVSDWLPTFVRIAGGSTARNKPLDGFDVWPAIAGGVETPRQELFHCDVDRTVSKTSMKGPYAALRVGDLKLLQHPNGTNEVYNVTEDAAEARNLLPALPSALLTHLLARLAWHRNDSVPGWRSDATCLPKLGPVQRNGSLVWMPTC